MAFALERAPFPMRDVVETWSLNRSDLESTITTTVSYGMGLGLFGKLFDALILRHIVGYEMRKGLRGLVKFVRAETLEYGEGPALKPQPASEVAHPGLAGPD